MVNSKYCRLRIELCH